MATDKWLQIIVLFETVIPPRNYNYLTFCVRYTNFVNHVGCTSVIKVGVVCGHIAFKRRAVLGYRYMQIIMLFETVIPPRN